MTGVEMNCRLVGHSQRVHLKGIIIVIIISCFKQAYDFMLGQTYNSPSLHVA